MSHRHEDPTDPGETYGMPELPCSRCRGVCCVDCSVTRDGKRLCEQCEWWLSLSDEQRQAATR